MIEYVDIIDENGIIIGTKTRDDAYKEGYALQVSGILVFRGNGKLILQRRGKNKKYPLCYDYSAAGHVLSGETFLEAAHRELLEELGLSVDKLILVGSVKAYNDKGKLRKLHSVFYTVCDDPLKIYEEELDSAEEFTKEQLENLITMFPEKITPTFIKVYKEIISSKNLFGMCSTF